MEKVNIRTQSAVNTIPNLRKRYVNVKIKNAPQLTAVHAFVREASKVQVVKGYTVKPHNVKGYTVKPYHVKGYTVNSHYRKISPMPKPRVKQATAKPKSGKIKQD